VELLSPPGGIEKLKAAIIMQALVKQQLSWQGVVPHGDANPC